MLIQENKKRWTTYTIRRDNSIYDSSDKKNEERIRVELTVIEKQVLALITEDANVTYETLGQKLTLGKTTLYKAVRNLKNLNIIVREGGRKDGYWKIINILGIPNHPNQNKSQENKKTLGRKQRIINKGWCFSPISASQWVLVWDWYL